MRVPDIVTPATVLLGKDLGIKLDSCAKVAFAINEVAVPACLLPQLE